MTAIVADGGTARLFQPGSPVPGHIIDLGLGYPDTAMLPPDALDISWLTPTQRQAALSYGPANGNGALIEVLKATVLRDVKAPNRLLITNGALDATKLVLPVLASPGSVIIAEESTFPGLITAALDANLEIVPVKTGAGGLDLDDLERCLRELRGLGRPIAAVYVMPTGSNPTGVCLTCDWRRELARLAERYDTTILEDDAYRDIFFCQSAPEPLYNMAPDHVVHIRSLSKVICPGVRLAAVAGPRPIVDAMTARRAVGGTSPLSSELVASFLARIDYEDYLTSLQRAYGTRRDVAVGRLATNPSISFEVPKAGFFVWVSVPESTTGNEVYAAALEHDVRILPGSTFSVNERDTPFIRISYSCATKDKLEAGIDVLTIITNHHQKG